MQKHFGTHFDPEGANVVILSGWLYIDQVLDIPLDGRVHQALRCTLMTKRPPDNSQNISEGHLNRGYPIVLTGKRMEIILDWARQRNNLPRVVIQGPLRKVNGNGNGDGLASTIIDAKYLDILDITPKNRIQTEEIPDE
ncbi:MAG: hypothetical protein ISR58_20400 [Anaerolineales bacterium]|nr:hypothetical protein [Anaerolineales bacterium]